MNYLFILIFIIIVNCSGNKVTNYHGIKSLKSKYDLIKVNVSNKNDLINILGPPSTTSDFNENKWFYLERLKVNQSLFKLGKQKIKTNNVLIAEFDQLGILKNKKLLNLDDMNDVKYIKDTTEKEFSKNNVLYGIFSTLREKINAPLRK